MQKGDVMSSYGLRLLLAITLLLIVLATATAQDIQPTPLLSGARPEATVLVTTQLLSQPRYPGGSEPLVLGEVTAGDRVIVLDVDDFSRGWFRVLWMGEDGLSPIFGWTRIDYVNYSNRLANPYAAPPGCAQPLAVVDSIDDLWDSTVRGKIAVVVDAYRLERRGDYPESTFVLIRNGQPLQDRARRFRSAGHFLMNGVVISADVRPNNVIGFNVITTTSEPIQFYGIIFFVPQGCDFGD
jgi:hypothetical protein